MSDTHRNKVPLGILEKAKCVMANLHCQLDQIQSCLGFTLLGVYIRVLLEKFSWKEKNHSKDGRQHPTDWRVQDK